MSTAVKMMMCPCCHEMQPYTVTLGPPHSAGDGTVEATVHVDNDALLTHVRECCEGITHQCPPDGSGIMPCCGRTPFEVALDERMTLDASLVTCGRTLSRASRRALR